MAVRYSITEILEKASGMKSTKDKVAALREHDNAPLRIVLKYTYDNTIEFLIPNTPPPWNPNEYEFDVFFVR